MEDNFVVMSGNPADGFILHGPFGDTEDACFWAGIELRHEEWWVVPVVPPEEEES